MMKIEHINLNTNNAKSRSIGRPKGITLIEILVAISLLILVIFAGSAIYLSGWNLFRDAQSRAQAARNATVPMLHMVKNLQNFVDIQNDLVPPGYVPPSLKFLYNIFQNPPGQDWSLYDLHTYWWDNQRPDLYPQQNEIFYFSISGTISIGKHITNCFIERLVDSQNNYTGIIRITITAVDNNDNANNSYTVTTDVQARHISPQNFWI